MKFCHSVKSKLYFQISLKVFIIVSDKDEQMLLEPITRITKKSAQKYSLLGPINIKLKQRIRYRTSEAYSLREEVELRCANTKSRANKVSNSLLI